MEERDLEKIEKLCTTANVSAEDAKSALDVCDGDILDAMIYLEKIGKVSRPEQETYSTSYEQQAQFQNVRDSVERQEKNERSHEVRDKIRALVAKIFRFMMNNFLKIEHKETEVLKVPVWLAVLALLIGWKVIIVAFVISLFFECKYSFIGEDYVDKANNVMNKASDAAEYVKNEFDKL